MVETNFKQTDLGKIPKDWDIAVLQDNITLKARIGWQGLTTAEYRESGDYYLITGTDFKNGYIDWKNCVFVDKIRYDQDKNIQVKEKDILVTKDGTIGKVAYIDSISKPTTLNSGVFVLRILNEKLDSRFIYYILMSFYFDNFLKQITAGSTITHLYQKDFVHFNFIVPPLPEQKAIAEVLSDTDHWITSLENLIAKKQLIKQGAMQKLLTPTEDWEVKKLGEVGKTYGGLSGKTKVDFGRGNSHYIPFMNVMKNVIIDNSFFEKVNLKQGEIQNKVLKNDLLFNGSSETPEELGISSVILEDIENLYLNSFCFGFRLFENNVNPLFLSYLFRSPYGRKIIFYLAQGATRYNLSKANFLELEISLPKSVVQQNYIATILSDMDAEIGTLEQKLIKAKQVKQGLMQKLLTGRIRLV